MSEVIITAFEEEPDGDGLWVSGTVDGIEARAHVWRSHLYADYAADDAARQAATWLDEDGNETAPDLIPEEDRLDTDEKRRAYLERELLSAAAAAPAPVVDTRLDALLGPLSP